MEITPSIALDPFEMETTPTKGTTLLTTLTPFQATVLIKMATLYKINSLIFLLICSEAFLSDKAHPIPQREILVQLYYIRILMCSMTNNMRKERAPREILMISHLSPVLYKNLAKQRLNLSRPSQTYQASCVLVCLKNIHISAIIATMHQKYLWIKTLLIFLDPAPLARAQCFKKKAHQLFKKIWCKKELLQHKAT